MKNNIIAIISLLILTIVSAIFSVNYGDYSWVLFAILLLSIFKFGIVTFQFMEIKKAHPIWKGLIIGFLVVFCSVFVIILKT